MFFCLFCSFCVLLYSKVVRLRQSCTMILQMKVRCVSLPREDLSQERHTKLCFCLPPFATGLCRLYYSHTTFEKTTFCPNMTKITAADYMVSGCSISIQFLNLRTLKKPITNKTALINSIAVRTIKWTFPVTHCAQL